MKNIAFVVVALFFAFACVKQVEAKVYIYEVITEDTSFHTASKLRPDAFLMYNGGRDIIYSLKVLDVYADKDFKQALRDYGLEDKNVRFLPHIRIPNKNLNHRAPYYWWR